MASSTSKQFVEAEREGQEVEFQTEYASFLNKPDYENNEKLTCNHATSLDLRDTKYRYLVLFFVCFISFGNFFCFDTPGALQEQFLNDLEITTSEFSLFYSLYSWPNIVLCFVGGYLLDTVFGLRLGTILFCSINLFGQIIFAVGCYVRKYWLMQVGRFIFGVGGETLTVSQSTYAAKWFKNKELNLVFGLQLSCARLGATINFLSMVSVYNMMTKSNHGNIGLSFTLFIAALSCVLSLCSSSVAGFLDLEAEKAIPVSRKLSSNRSQSTYVKILGVRHFSFVYWLVVAICVTYYMTVFPFVALGT